MWEVNCLMLFPSQETNGCVLRNVHILTFEINTEICYIFSQAILMECFDRSESSNVIIINCSLCELPYLRIKRVVDRK
jgi:hypothetical protein